jgi:hypothetical protein
MRNNIFQFLWRKPVSLLGVLLLAVFLTGCLDDDNQNVQPVPVGYVYIYHAAPDAPVLDILVDNRQINSQPFDYTDRAGYLNFYTGSRNIKFNSANASNALIDTAFSVADGKAYSLFVINRLSNLETFIVRDSAETPASGKAMVRFVHLSPDAAAMEVTVDDEANPLFTQTGFKQATNFQELDAKSYVFKVKSAGSPDQLSTNDLMLREGEYYTLVVRGFATPPAGNTNVLSVELL